jgi:type VI secretion system protein ImpH
VTLESALRDLERRAQRASFFALVGELARLFPDAPPVGGLGPAEGEVLRFHHDVRPIFHASDVTGMRVTRGRDGTRVELTTAFLGVVGSVSPLANYFTEDVLRAESLDDRTLRAFYDFFHHRLVTLLYRALLRATPAAEVHVLGGDRTTTRSIGAAGVPARDARKDALPPTRWLGIAPIVSRRIRGKDALEAAIGLALPGVPFRIVDFVARDVPLPSSERAQLGVQHVDLGRSARLGRRLLRQTGLVRLAVGPVDRATFDALAPGGVSHDRLKSVVDHITGGLIETDMDIAVTVGDEPRARLGRAYGTRLGATALLARPRIDRPMSVRVKLSGDAAAPAEEPEEAAPAPSLPASPRDPRGAARSA